MVTPSFWSRLADVAGLVATPLVPSHYLELVSPLWATHTLKARVVSVKDETAEARTLTLKPGRMWRGFRAGQHARVGVVIGGRRVVRTYSLSSSPDRADRLVTITVKAMEGGRVSPFLARDLEPGVYLTLSQAEGDFVLPEKGAGPLSFITGGSGITPVMSMLRTFALRGDMPDVRHVHYAPRAADVIFGAELSALASTHPRYQPSIVHTREGGAHFSLDALPADWRERQVFACGPESLLDAVAAVVPSAKMERFHAPRAALPVEAIGGRVHLRMSGIEAVGDPKTPLLEVAERAGVFPPHGCRMGICHSCDATLASGCVRDLRTGELIDEPGARVQPCVCAAAGDVEIDL
jgi:ferredoxin-NADP reductase